MNFWERVQELIDLKNYERKKISLEAGFNYSNIGKGIKTNSYPAADTAVRIAKLLNVSVEYLVTGEESAMNDNKEEKVILQKLHEYRDVINILETFKPNVRNNIIEVIRRLKDELR